MKGLRGEGGGFAGLVQWVQGGGGYLLLERDWGIYCVSSLSSMQWMEN